MNVLCTHEDGGATVYINEEEIKAFKQSFDEKELRSFLGLISSRIKALNQIKEMFVGSLIEQLNAQEMEYLQNLYQKVERCL